MVRVQEAGTIGFQGGLICDTLITVMPVNIDDPEIQKLFWSHVQPAPDDRCWPWMRTTVGKLGYGQFKVHQGGERKSFRANRLAFYIVNGYWPVFACHTCDNPLCCNPKHIYDGTPLQNMLDRKARGRANAPTGVSHWNSRLAESDVHEIRKRYAAGGVTYLQLGKEFGCSWNMIGCIVRRHSWTHI